MRQAIVAAALAVSIVGSAQAQRKAPTDPLPVKVGDVVSSYAWPVFDTPNSPRAPGAYICPGAEQAVDIYKAEEQYLALQESFKRDPVQHQVWVDTDGEPAEPMPELYGCALAPAGTLLHVVRLVFGGTWVQVEVRGVRGITLAQMLTR